MPPARLGLVYSHTGLRKFIDAIGAAAHARAVLHRAATISARRGAGWGLVNEVVAGRRARRARRRAARPRSPPTRRSRCAGNKRVIRELLAAEGALDPEVEAELVALREACFRSEDFDEGVRAFAEKRAPEWQGR